MGRPCRAAAARHAQLRALSCTDLVARGQVSERARHRSGRRPRSPTTVAAGANSSANRSAAGIAAAVAAPTLRDHSTRRYDDDREHVLIAMGVHTDDVIQFVCKHLTDPPTRFAGSGTPVWSRETARQVCDESRRKADNLLIKPTAGARPAPPCTPGRFIRRHARRGLTPEESRTTRRHPGWQRPLTDRPIESHRRLRVAAADLHANSPAPYLARDLLCLESVSVGLPRPPC